MKNIFFLICLISMLSCSIQKNIISNYKSEGFDIASIKGSSVLLCVNPIIEAGTFRMAFDNEYPTENVFRVILSNKLEEKLRGFLSVNADKNTRIGTLFSNPSISNNGVEKLLDQIKENYVLGIKRVAFTRSAAQDAQTPTTGTTSTPSGARAMARGNTGQGIMSNDCVTKIVAEVWSVKEKKKVAEFTSIGQSKIILRAYDRALKDALENSTSILTDYIEKNKE